jgi:hypothetical protein
VLGEVACNQRLLGGRSPDRLGLEEVRAFQVHLDPSANRSPNSRDNGFVQSLSIPSDQNLL